MTDFYRDDLALIHDSGFGGTAVAAAGELLTALQARAKLEGLIVDLGCGSGILSAAMSKAGYDVLGIDISEAMIELARRRVTDGEFRVASLLSVPVPSCVAVAIVGEGVNYLADETHSIAAMGSLFARIYAALEPGGVLLLDAAGPGRVVGGGNRLGAVEGDGWAVMFRSEESGDGILTRWITSFRRVGELYRRDEEVHRQRLIDPKQLKDVLRGVGFRVRVLVGYGDEQFPPGLTGFLAEKPE
jgi:SAM-dependent methyltransferase